MRLQWGTGTTGNEFRTRRAVIRAGEMRMFGFPKWCVRFGATTLVVVPTAQPQRCRDAYMDLVQETGILCPGDPTTWVSYTLPTDGFGYSINTYELDEGRSEVQVTYHHRDGRVAVRIMECEGGRCVDTASNGVPFP